jgi:hypothetical protein
MDPSYAPGQSTSRPALYELILVSIDADASKEDIEALVAQSQKRSAVFDALTNPTNVTVEVA